MKLNSSLLARTAVLLLPAAHAAVIQESWTGLDQVVPDATPVGVADTRIISTPLTEIQSVTVTLNLSSGYVGDLYAILIHEGMHAVLLNRPGRRPGDIYGYLDGGGLDVTFADDAANGDIHAYRLTLGGDHETPLGGPLTGEWQPDGRTTDPNNASLGDARTATLADFTGLNPNGAWTLFLADLSAVGEATLESWSLELVAVPEPATTATTAALLLAGAAVWRRKTARRGV